MLREEMKKIWRPGMIAVLVLLGFVYYTMFLEFHIRYFPNGPQNAGLFTVAAELVKESGTRMTGEARQRLEQKLPELYAEADVYVADFAFTKQYGLATYEAYTKFYRNAMEGVAEGQAADQNAMYADAMRLNAYLTSEATGNIEGRIRGTESYLRRYDVVAGEEKERKIFTGNSETNGIQDLKYLLKRDGKPSREYLHAAKTFYGEDEAWRNILPAQVPETTSDYLGRLLVWQCLSIGILLSPLLVRDRMSRMRALQWSSRAGRGIFTVQLKAALLSALLMNLLNLALFGGLFLSRGVSVFFPCRMFSFMDTPFCWPNWTYGTWCLALVLLGLLASMGVAAAVFFLSRYSSHYIGMLLKLIPVIVAAAVFCPKLLGYAFYFNNPLYALVPLPYVEVVTAAAIFLTGAVLCAGAVRKQKQLELLEV